MMSDSGIVVAVIAAGASVLGAVMSYVFTRSNQIALQNRVETHETNQATLSRLHDERQTRLESNLEEGRSAAAARREYEYKARIRLYESYEPLLFEMVERAERAYFRILGMAARAKEGSLSPGQGYLSVNNPSYKYYLTTSMYYLLAPLTAFVRMQRQLTLVDLTVDRAIAGQYSLAKLLYFSTSEEFEFAKLAPKLTYEPYVADWKRRRAQDPARHWRQGLAVGRLDDAVEALVVQEANGSPRCLSYGEFLSAYVKGFDEADPDSVQTALLTIFDPLRDILTDFHPRDRPVLWRMLITHAHLYRTLTRIRDAKIKSMAGNGSTAAATVPPAWSAFSAEARREFDWRSNDEQASIPDKKVLVDPFEAAEAYLTKYFGPPSWID